MAVIEDLLPQIACDRDLVLLVQERSQSQNFGPVEILRFIDDEMIEPSGVLLTFDRRLFLVEQKQQERQVVNVDDAVFGLPVEEGKIFLKAPSCKEGVGGVAERILFLEKLPLPPLCKRGF